MPRRSRGRPRSINGRSAGKRWSLSLQVSGGLAGSGPARDRRASYLRLLAGQLIEGGAHRRGLLATVGRDTLADRKAFQLDEPRVDAAAGGVDSDGVTAVPAQPELVACVVLALVGHPGHGSDRTFHAEPPSNAAPGSGGRRTGRSAADARLQIDGSTRGGYPCDHRSCHRRWVLLRYWVPRPC